MSTPHRTLTTIHHLCRYTVAALWFYQGLVPKLLGPARDELAMGMAFGLSAQAAPLASYMAGATEIVFALCVLVFHRALWPQLVSAMAMAGLLVFVAVWVPHYLVEAFNPVVMNGAGCVLSVIGMLVLRARRGGE